MRLSKEHARICRWACRASLIRGHGERVVVFYSGWWVTHLLLVLALVEELCDLDLDIAQISFTRDSLPLLLVWVRGLLRTWRTALEAAVPVV